MLYNKFFVCVVLVFVLISGIFLFCYFSVGYVLSSTESLPKKVSLVVVLGGGDGARYAKGKALVAEGLSSHLLLINPNNFERDDADKLKDIRFWIDNIPRNSWQEAKAVRAWMEAYGWKSVMVVSDPPHMLRLRYTWSSVFRDSNLSYSLIPTEPDWWIPARWWSNSHSKAFVESEVLKLGYYILNYRFGIF